MKAKHVALYGSLLFLMGVVAGASLIKAYSDPHPVVSVDSCPAEEFFL